MAGARPFPIKRTAATDVAFGAEPLYRMMADLVSEGAVLAADFNLSQNGAGNLSVNVAPGEGYVRHDAPEGGTRRILLAATLNSGTPGSPNQPATAGVPIFLSTFTTPHATLPRVDRVVARIRDAALIGGADVDWVFEVIAGTPGASATLANAAAGGGGAAAVPSNAMLIGNVLVRAAATSILTADIDNGIRPLALIGAGRVGKNDAGQVVASALNAVNTANSLGGNTIIALPAFTSVAGAVYKIEFEAAWVTSPGPGATNVTTTIFRNGIAVQSDVWVPPGGYIPGFHRMYRDAPGAGSMTYALVSSFSGGSASTFGANMWATVTRES